MTQTLSSIQFLRFAAAFAVCVHHAHTATIVHGLMAPSSDLVRRLTDVGAAGVHIFFVISGFIMVFTVFGPSRRETAGRFLAKRALRIFPIYWLVCACYLLAAQLGFIHFAFGLDGLVKSLLLLPGSSSLIVGPGWTLSYEVYFYLCFAAVVAVGRVSALWLLAIVFVLSIAVGAVVQPQNPFLKLATSHLLLEFIVGGAIGALFLSRHTVSRSLANAATFAGLAGFAASVILPEEIPSIAVWGIPSALLVFGLAMREKCGPLPASLQRVSWLGDSSYLLYLIHTLVFDVTLKFLVYANASSALAWGWVGLNVALAVVLAIVLHARIERPLNTALARSLRRSPDIAGAGPGPAAGGSDRKTKARPVATA